MIEDTASAPAEGEASPQVPQARDGTSFLDREKDNVKRAIAAIERWYAAHFHRHALAGTAPLSADDKAALIQHVADAVAPPATQE